LELTRLLNTTDKNENKIFSYLNIETHIVAYYNRIVGYRNTERGIAMLHSVIVIMIKKMLAMKSKTATLKISEQTYPANNLNNQAQSTIYTAKI
jgi:hypothetical protein